MFQKKGLFICATMKEILLFLVSFFSLANGKGIILSSVVESESPLGARSHPEFEVSAKGRSQISAFWSLARNQNCKDKWKAKKCKKMRRIGKCKKKKVAKKCKKT